MKLLIGGAAGIDRLAEEYADRMRLSKIILRPQYKLYGRSAPIRRNMELVQMADRILAIWDGRSKGTSFTVRYAKKLNKIVETIIVNDL